jgi:Domain of unknown function (DUF6438)
MRTLVLVAFVLAGCKSTPEAHSAEAGPPTKPTDAAPTAPPQPTVAPGADPVPEPAKPVPGPSNGVTVELTRGACFGRCPMYTVAVSTNGDVTFKGVNFVSVKGMAKGKLGREALTKLTARLEASGFGTWKTSYENHQVTDMATVELTWNGKTIRHYLGDEKAPEALTQLENDVDALIGTAQWVSEAPTE